MTIAESLPPQFEPEKPETPPDTGRGSKSPCACGQANPCHRPFIGIPSVLTAWQKVPCNIFDNHKYYERRSLRQLCPMPEARTSVMVSTSCLLCILTSSNWYSFGNTNMLWPPETACTTLFACIHPRRSQACLLSNRSHLPPKKMFQATISLTESGEESLAPSPQGLCLLYCAIEIHNQALDSTQIAGIAPTNANRNKLLIWRC